MEKSGVPERQAKSESETVSALLLERYTQKDPMKVLVFPYIRRNIEISIFMCVPLDDQIGSTAFW